MPPEQRWNTPSYTTSGWDDKPWPQSQAPQPNRGWREPTAQKGSSWREGPSTSGGHASAAAPAVRQVMPTRPAATTWEATPTKKARIDKKAEEGAVDTPSPQTVFDLLGQVRPLNQDDYGWNKFWIPPDSIEEYVSTLRQQCGHSSAAFRWPHSKLSFQKAFELTLHLMPPGHMSVMQNGMPIPKDSDTWEVCHHGTSPQALLKIVREGLRPATSAVSEQVGQKYGIKLDDGQPAKVPTIGLTSKAVRASCAGASSVKDL